MVRRSLQNAIALSVGYIGAVLATTEFRYGGAVGTPYDINAICGDIELINPELLMNWGPNTRENGAWQFGAPNTNINACNNPNINFLPTLWGQTWDDPELDALPNSPTPFGVILENEPNWGDAAYPGPGCGMSADTAATRYKNHTDTINRKWGVGVVRLITPSPKFAQYDPALGGQVQWLTEFFKQCNCLQDVWAINHHDYSCNLGQIQQNIQNLQNAFPGKNIFLGELGCDGPSYQVQAQLLHDFHVWAYTQPTIVGYIWAGLNNVGSQNAEMVVDHALTPIGQMMVQLQAQYPPRAYDPGSGGGSTSGAAHWAQCGGTGYTGPTSCVSPYSCTYSSPYYSQCL